MLTHMVKVTCCTECLCTIKTYVFLHVSGMGNANTTMIQGDHIITRNSGSMISNNGSGKMGHFTAESETYALRAGCGQTGGTC